VKDVAEPIDEIIHGVLNEKQVNVLRAYPGRGIRIGGAVTLSSDTLVRYINVRRLLLMIAESIDESTQWTVFEPNNPELWAEIARSARTFLDGIWRAGMLDGATAQEAYSVRCDETTNPPEDTERGLLQCEIGVLPPYPAEFVIVRIGKTDGGTDIRETRA
ncbi:MAG: phage tail sheath family protein, partial [Anaerolineae bacterium]|nr:phage tail sheath family protein [Anaerolineae bacterium]